MSSTQPPVNPNFIRDLSVEAREKYLSDCSTFRLPGATEERVAGWIAAARTGTVRLSLPVQCLEFANDSAKLTISIVKDGLLSQRLSSAIAVISKCGLGGKYSVQEVFDMRCDGKAHVIFGSTGVAAGFNDLGEEMVGIAFGQNPDQVSEDIAADFIYSVYHQNGAYC